MRGILIIVEAGGAERKIEIGHHRIQRKIARDGPGHVVRDRGCANSTLCADDGDDAADGLCFRRGKQPADRAHHVKGIDGRDHIVADAATHQFAIKRDVIDATDHDDARSRIAHGCELIEAGEDVVAAFGLENDDIRRRRAAIGFDGGRHAAHLNLEVGLTEASILPRRLHRRRGLHGLAESLHGHPRGRGDVIVHGRRSDVRRRFGILACVADHLPVSLSLAFSDSGYSVAVVVPLRYFSKPSVRRIV
ncbi:hypothetical protein GALL_512450 [mine drainage metagenome]|uniref:Uncharacterized protein n=1 Tax=mine drainage metagenome TaxID=410659 RepID=A0A1J5PI17_9ZZZZ